MRVTQIVDAYAFKASAAGHGAPWLLQIRTRALVFMTGRDAGNDVNTYAREIGKDGKGRGIQDDSLLASFTSGQK